MSKDKIQLLSPLFLKYQADYEKNPRGRVFAPLAEIYRKLGMSDKAMEILSQGIRFHPTYVMGYLGLAFCYFDLKQYSLAYNTLKPFLETSRDNIRLQKLFADICLELNYKDEALDTYKYLLFINPRDKEVGLQVANLEKLVEEQYRPTHQPIYIPESEFKSESSLERNQTRLFDVDKLENKPLASKVDFDDWKTFDLSREQPPVKINDSYDLWSLEKGTTPQPEEKKEEIHRVELDLDDVEFDFHNESADEEAGQDDEDEATSAPLVTHTLVDLYCGQGHIEKALEVLEKILILNPNDQKTIKKISEIKELMGADENHPVIEISTAKQKGPPRETTPIYTLPEFEVVKKPSEKSTEEDGRKNLMNLFDQQVRPAEIFEVDSKAQEKQRLRLLEDKLTQFLKKIQKRALDYQARV